MKVCFFLKKSTIVIINVVITVLILLFLFNMGSESIHNYEKAITFALWSSITFGIQLLINLGFAICFFVKKDNEKGKAFLISMLISSCVAAISFYLIGIVG